MVSIGTLIVLMLWLNLNAPVLLVGFEINNSIDVNHVLRMKEKEKAGVGVRYSLFCCCSLFVVRLGL